MAPRLPERPAQGRLSEPTTPAAPPATAAVGDDASGQAGSDGEKDGSAADDGATVADAPPPLPKDRRPAPAREMPPRVKEGPARAELPALDYSKRRPSLPPRALGD